MRLTGARTVRTSRQTVWDFLLDPARLRQCLPGCERFEQTGPDRFDATLRLGVAFLKGNYTGTLRVEDRRETERLDLVVEGGGPLGTLTASGTVTLMDASGSTQVLYEGEAQVGGRVAALGERVVEATASRLIAAFFDCISSHVERA